MKTSEYEFRRKRAEKGNAFHFVAFLIFLLATSLVSRDAPFRSLHSIIFLSLTSLGGVISSGLWLVNNRVASPDSRPCRLPDKTEFEDYWFITIRDNARDRIQMMRLNPYKTLNLLRLLFLPVSGIAMIILGEVLDI